jgi:aspartate/methionine/tyrosine aminotransferase
VRTLREFLSRTPALDGFVEHGTVAFPRVRDLADATPLVTELFKRAGTAVVPGRFFAAPAHFRIGLGVAPDTLIAGLTNLRALLRPES